jgi:hypothetical protein
VRIIFEEETFTTAGIARRAIGANPSSNETRSDVAGAFSVFRRGMLRPALAVARDPAIAPAQSAAAIATIAVDVATR